MFGDWRIWSSPAFTVSGSGDTITWDSLLIFVSVCLGFLCYLWRFWHHGFGGLRGVRPGAGLETLASSMAWSGMGSMGSNPPPPPSVVVFVSPLSDGQPSSLWSAQAFTWTSFVIYCARYGFRGGQVSYPPNGQTKRQTKPIAQAYPPKGQTKRANGQTKRANGQTKRANQTGKQSKPSNQSMPLNKASRTVCTVSSRRATRLFSRAAQRVI